MKWYSEEETKELRESFEEEILKRTSEKMFATSRRSFHTLRKAMNEH